MARPEYWSTMPPSPPLGGAHTGPEITRPTRRAIAEVLTTRCPWPGSMTEHGFLNELYDLPGMRSADTRPAYNNAYPDIEKHRYHNNDWGGLEWVFGGPRFNLYGCDDEQFGEFWS